MAKTVLVTGASSGIGKATAMLLASKGYKVYTAARRVTQMDDLKERGCIPLKMDITQEEDIAAVVEKISFEQGGVDILVNNAGISLYGSLEEAPHDRARYQFDVNFFGPGRLTQLVLPRMREKRWGKIINISSGEGKVHMPLAGWYVASKFALEGMSDCLRVETGEFNIDVIIIEPGAVDTEIMDGFIEPLIEYSGHGPYKRTAGKMAEWFRGLNAEAGTASPPGVIAETVLKAIQAKRPKTRYAAGVGVKWMLLVRKWTGDRFIDRLLLRMFG